MHLICCSKFKKQEPRFMKALIPLFAGCILSFTSFHLSAGETFTESIDIQGKSIVFKVETLVSGLDHPWSLAELPNQGFLITERSGKLRVFQQGKLSAPIAGVPKVFVAGQGGLFDIALAPDFATSGRLFLSFAHGDMKANTTRVVSARLQGDRLEDVQVIFEVEPYKDTPVHYGGRLTLLPDNTLLLTTGDGFDYREQAQKMDSLLGKVVRFAFNGGIPKDNPFFNQEGKHSAIWTLGHRNPQGLMYDSVRQQVFLHEHGPRGGDEINLLQPGRNYGWPIATYGKDYSGATISPFTEYEGTQQPILHWTPSIAPSGFAVYYGSQFPELAGDFLVGALAARELRWVDMNGNRVEGQYSLLKSLNSRIRDVRVGLDGAIYLITDSDNGKLLKITRANLKKR
jgi:glucose/arabinose dehydrogenase